MLQNDFIQNKKSTTNRSIFSGNNDAKILLKFGVDVNKTFQFGSTNSTALITAAEYGLKKNYFYILKTMK